MDPRQVFLQTVNPNMELLAWLGTDPSTVTGGYGGWDVIKRPRRLSLTQWNGRDPFIMDLPLLLDNYIAQESIEIDCSTLERMALPPAQGLEPPIVGISGPVPHTDLDWVITDLTWGDSLRQERTGYRLRQAVVIHLLHYVADDRLVALPAAEAARQMAAAVDASNTRKSGANPKVPKQRVYTVKTGDTLSTIASAKLGDWKLWSTLATLNDKRDPKDVKPGEVIRLN